jgi:hypothetical protein
MRLAGFRIYYLIGGNELGGPRPDRRKLFRLERVNRHSCCKGER